MNIEQLATYQKLAFAFILTIVVAAFTACATTSDMKAQAAVTYATLKVIDAVGENNKLERAQRIYNITHETIQFVHSGMISTVPQIEDRVRSKINWDRLDRADKILVDMLIISVADQLKIRLANSTGEPKELKVKKVLYWVIEATKMYGVKER